MKRVLLLLSFFTSLLAYSQIEEEAAIVPKTFSATVINAQNSAPMESVHIINLNQLVGVITDAKGKFTIPAAANDTLYLSYLGFKPQKIRVTNDMLTFGNTEIALTELAYALEEVTVAPYLLTGYLEIDVKNLPLNNTTRPYSISGLPTRYEGGNKKSGAVTNLLGAILNPVDQLRNLFGKKPKQLRKLHQIKEDEQIKNLLASKFDRQTLTELLQLEKEDIEHILNYCNYSKSFIHTANDLQILEAVSHCYEEYKTLNKD